MRRGENSGRVLTDVNVVRSIARIGAWDGSLLSVTVPGDTWNRGADALVILLQAADHGPVWGVAAVPL